MKDKNSKKRQKNAPQKEWLPLRMRKNGRKETTAWASGERKIAYSNRPRGIFISRKDDKNMNNKYHMISGLRYIPGAGIRRTYGIKLSETHKRISDISTKRELVRSMVVLLNRGQVSLEHFDAVVLDALPL